MHLLLANDDEATRDLLEAVLTARGHTVEKHADGAALWAAYERMPAPMVILDRQMPRMDGLEVCRRVRAHPAGEATFLLVITAGGGMDDLGSVLDAGADDYVAGPVTSAEVAARLRIAEQGIENAAARRNADNELYKARYLAGIGEVSLVLQHEINNPLAALLTNSSLITSGLLTADEIKESLATIDVQARRIADVVKRLNAIEAKCPQGDHMVDVTGSRPRRNAPE